MRLREAYRTDRTPIFQQLLTAGSITDVYEDVGSYIDFGTQDRALALQIQDDQRTLETMRQTTVNARAAKAELRAQTLAQKKQLDARMKDLKAAQARLAALQRQTRQQLALQRTNWARMHQTQGQIKVAIARDEAAERRLAAHIRALVAATQRHYGNIPSQYNGSLAWPMNGVSARSSGPPASRGSRRWAAAPTSTRGSTSRPRGERPSGRRATER